MQRDEEECMNVEDEISNEKGSTKNEVKSRTGVNSKGSTPQGSSIINKKMGLADYNMTSGVAFYGSREAFSVESLARPDSIRHLVPPSGIENAILS
jgi:hypothetical protein